MAEPILSINGLSAGYGDIQVLWDLDLSVAADEITCIVGSNGAGKTTLLRTISGLIPANSGSISFVGQPITNWSPEAILDRGIVHVPEGRRLFKGLTVRDNLLLGAYLRRDRDIDRDLRRMFELFPILRDRQKQDATTLSGGEQQMCAIARGLMARPKLLMIDELSLGLAPRVVERLVETLQDVQRTGLTILLVEQDVMTAFELARFACVMEVGRVARCGTTEALSQDPVLRSAYMGV